MGYSATNRTMPDGTFRGMTREITYPHASLSSFGRGKPHAGDAVRLLVIEDHVRHLPELCTAFPDVLFDI